MINMDVVNFLESHYQLAVAIRDKQKELLRLSKTEYGKRNKAIRQLRAMETKLDESLAQLRLLIDTSFQPELYK